MEEWEQFRTLLKERLKDRGALARLAKSSGLNSPVIGRWERGESRPSPANLERFAPSVGVPYEDLLKMCGYLPGQPSTDLDPRLSAFLAAIESGWQAMDDRTREVAERGARALFTVAAVNTHATPTAKSPGARNNGRGRPQQPPLQSHKHDLVLAASAGAWASMLALFSRWLRPLPTPTAATA